jgi:Flp pilus assembly protein TadG
VKVKKLLRDEKGVALPLVAIVLGLFALGFMALVVDVGNLYIQRKAMVTSADAAALAGAQVLRDGREAIKKGEKTETQVEAEAKKVAEDYAKNNKADEGQINVFVGSKEVTLTNGTEDYRQVVEVTVGKKEPSIFAKFITDEDTNVKAYAAATWGFINKTYIGNFIPLFTFDRDYKLDTDVFLHEKLENCNYGFIDIGSGMGDVKEAIAGKNVGGTYIYDNYLDGEPGAGESLAGAVETRMKLAQSKTTAEDRQETMLGLVPVLDYSKFMSYPGNITGYDHDGNPVYSPHLKLPIKYFAYFEIIDVISKNSTLGSGEALDPNKDYTKRGLQRNGGTQVDYAGKIPEYLTNDKGEAVYTYVLGRYTGKIVEARTLVEAGDQINPNPSGDLPAPYSKLIK